MWLGNVGLNGLRVVWASVSNKWDKTASEPSFVYKSILSQPRDPWTVCSRPGQSLVLPVRIENPGVSWYCDRHLTDGCHLIPPPILARLTPKRLIVVYGERRCDGLLAGAGSRF